MPRRSKNTPTQHNATSTNNTGFHPNQPPDGLVHCLNILNSMNISYTHLETPEGNIDWIIPRPSR